MDKGQPAQQLFGFCPSTAGESHLSVVEPKTIDELVVPCK
jgi:hypothetical protein